MEPEYDASQYDISLRNLLLSIWRRLWIILLVAVLFVGAAVGFTLTRPLLYQANILMLVGEEGNEAPANLGAQVTGLQQLTVTMTETVATAPVAEGTMRELGLPMSRDAQDALLENLVVEQIPATQVIEVSYADPDPRRAQQIVNTIGEVFPRQVDESASGGANGVGVAVWDWAAVPEEPGVRPVPFLKFIILPRVVALILNALLGLVVGLMVGVGLALLLEHLGERRRASEKAKEPRAEAG